jgi:hypothetical protein
LEVASINSTSQTNPIPIFLPLKPKVLEVPLELEMEEV